MVWNKVDTGETLWMNTIHNSTLSDITLDLTIVTTEMDERVFNNQLTQPVWYGIFIPYAPDVSQEYG